MSRLLAGSSNQAGGADSDRQRISANHSPQQFCRRGDQAVRGGDVGMEGLTGGLTEQVDFPRFDISGGDGQSDEMASV